MTKFYPSMKALLVVCFTLALASAAQAQATRTWVSGVGDDVNPCSRTAPCKTFAGAISKTAKDGEISVLDPGGFGAVTITKSIYINGTHGSGFGGILHSLTNGMIINITDPLDVRKTVRIRSIDFNGASTGTNGISISTSTLGGTQVHVEDCVIDGSTGNGINATFGSGGGTLYVSDSYIHKNATGVRLSATSGFAVANISNSHIEHNTTGVDAQANAFATINGSVISSNAGDAVKTSGTGATINVSESVMAHNTGAAANASLSGTTIRAASNKVYNNGSSFLIAAGATIASDAENRVSGNGGGVAPNGVITKQ